MNKDLNWVTSTYFSEGLPYAIITTLSVVMMADLGSSNAEITALTSLLAVPWMIKALWSPLVGRPRVHHPQSHTLDRWMWSAQGWIALCFLAVSILLYFHGSTTLLMGCFALAAFASATYDVACDGFYLHTLPPAKQSYYVGVQSTAYRLSMIFASGVLAALSSFLLPVYHDDAAQAWHGVMGVAAILMGGFTLFHHAVLPRARDQHAVAETTPTSPAATPPAQVLSYYKEAFLSLLQKKEAKFALVFLLLYRLGEALLSKMTILFLKAPVDAGGLALNNAEYGLYYGTLGVGALTVGGLLGGMCISRFGWKRTLLPLALALNVPDLLYVALAMVQPTSRLLIASAITIEQLGYGLGFTAYLVYMQRLAQGTAYTTAHYAILTALMALGMNLPSFLSGFMQQHLGYLSFFLVTVAATLPGTLLSAYLSLRQENQ